MADIETAVWEMMVDKSNGDSLEMGINGSVTPVNFDYVVPTTGYSHLRAVRLNMMVHDDVKLIPNGFFSLVELTNGMLIQILEIDGTTIRENFSTDVHPLTNHVDIGLLAGVDVDTDSSQNLMGATIRWTIDKVGTDVPLHPGETLRVVIQDDLSTLQAFHSQIQGVLVGH